MDESKNNPETYKVSVIIPTYKRSEFLDRAIKSIFAQTHKNIEVVVVDDNNTTSKYRGETEAIVNKYLSGDNFVYIKNCKNLGGALARNIGIERSTGDYITFLDDDDIYLKEKVSRQLQFMVKNDIEMSFEQVRIHNDSNILIDYRDHRYIKECTKEELLKQHILHHLTPTATYMYKRESLLKIGGFDDVSMGQEFMLMLKSIEKNLKIGYLPVADVVQYAHNGERISVGKNKMNKEVELYNYKKKYTDNFNYKEKRYLKFRHHAVMTVVGKRSGDSMVFMSNLMKAFITSPGDCLKEAILHVQKMRKYN